MVASLTAQGMTIVCLFVAFMWSLMLLRNWGVLGAFTMVAAV